MSEAAIARFAGELRRAGLTVGPAAVLDYVRAAQLLPPTDLYWAGRSTLVTSPPELVVYDRVFGSFFGEVASLTGPDAADPSAPSPAEDSAYMTASAIDEPAEEETAGALAASVELLRARDFAACTADELVQLRQLIRDLSVVAPRRRNRRWQVARHGPLDLRRTARQVVRTAGMVEQSARRRRATKPRRLVFLVDVSGSMTSYARMLLIFAQAGLRANRAVEVFCFGTRLTRVTRELRSTDPDRALDRAARAVVDWDGGTRIGASVKAFLDQHGHNSLARGAVMLVCSDGLERDDPELLRREMGRLARLAHAVVWLNPLKGGTNYQPLARGMRAALGSIDLLLSGHNLASLDELTELLPQLNVGTRGRP